MPVWLLIVVLTCASGTKAADCTRENARNVRVVGRTPMPTACALGGMMTAAREQDDAREVCVIRCERSRI